MCPLQTICNGYQWGEDPRPDADAGEKTIYGIIHDTTKELLNYLQIGIEELEVKVRQVASQNLSENRQKSSG